MKLIGKVLQLKDNINTDDIIAGQYLRTQDSNIWKEHIFESLDPTITSSILQKKFIIAGANFGCGSSREQAVLALKACGILAIIARSFGRIFYRNCINNGLIPIIFTDMFELNIGENEEVVLDVGKSILIIGGKKIALCKIPAFIIEVYKSGGLLPYYQINGKIKYNGNQK